MGEQHMCPAVYINGYPHRSPVLSIMLKFICIVMILWNWTDRSGQNSVDPEQTAPLASGSTPFAIPSASFELITLR